MYFYFFYFYCVIHGARAGEKAPAPGCCCVALGYCGGKIATILINFLTIYTQIEGKNRYT